MTREKGVAIFAAAVVVCLFAIGSQAAAGVCSPGDKAKVLWKGTWYPASVLKTDGNKCFIHYDGYGSNWDEWVGPGRIKVQGASASVSVTSDFGDGDPVQVLWKGTWYPAHVIGVKGNQLKIHYDGYDNSWDEWVGPNRYRK